MSYETVDGEEKARVTRSRRIVRRDDHLPFVPFGVIPLAGLGLLFLIAIGPFAFGVQSATKRAVAEALAANGMDWARTSVSGQSVTISGEPASGAEAHKARMIAKEAASATPFGLARPATRVTVPQGPYKARPETRDEEETAAVAPLQDVTDDAAAAPSWHFTITNSVLTLTGAMPDQATKDTVVRHAFNKISPPYITGVDDQLEIAGVEPPAGYIQVAMRGVNTISKCDTGQAAFEQGRFSLRCELPESEAAAVRRDANASMPLGTVGKVDILPHEAVITCEAELSDLLMDARIEFDSSSSVIDASSNALLDAVAAAVRRCPGTLRIEGHTDSTGPEDDNETLSRNRALAVRNALVARNLDPQRLIAEGYGATRPIAGNTTPEGRARNRRIEIRVVRASE
ncbi:OmpA family protein [uncultured Hyphomonas sp.]|uniref:OmpA family protein n=1 Tax=uncultured Hyphomonas sp. TaxID=225298 RepID=UPI002AAB26EE|nr:OmpA family protein [uncultured Hyphomonas sp.]